MGADGCEVCAGPETGARLEGLWSESFCEGSAGVNCDGWMVVELMKPERIRVVALETGKDDSGRFKELWHF